MKIGGTGNGNVPGGSGSPATTGGPGGDGPKKTNETKRADRDADPDTTEGSVPQDDDEKREE